MTIINIEFNDVKPLGDSDISPELVECDGNPDNVDVENDDMAATIEKQEPLAKKKENVCGISDILIENVPTKVHGPDTPRQCGPDWQSGPPPPWPVTQASHCRIPGGKNQLSKVSKMFQVSTAKTAVEEKQINTKVPNFENVQSENVGHHGYYDRLEIMFRFIVYLMCYSVNMMRWAGRASMVTMNQEVFNTNSEYEGSRKCGGFFEPKKILNEDPEHENSNPRLVQAITNKIWKVLQILYFPPLLLRWWHTDRNMEVGDVCAYRGELVLCEVTEAMKDDRDKFKDVEAVVKSKQNNELEFQLEPLLYEPDDQGDVVQVEPLYEPDDDKEHSVNDLIAQIPVSVIDLQILPQYDQGGGDVQHDMDKHQVCEVDRM